MSRLLAHTLVGLWIACISALWPWQLCSAQTSTPTSRAVIYRFSPVNQYGIARTAAYWNPIIAYVSEKSGVPIELKIGRTSADTTAYVIAREVEFIFSNHLFSPQREKLGWRVFARRNIAPVHGEIIVPNESTITELAQLAGQAVAFPGPEALIAYKFPYAQLLSRRIDIQVVFCGNMDAALLQMFSGKASAVGANSQLAESFARREQRTYRVLWRSEPLHDLPLMVAAKVPEKIVAAVANAFIQMAQDPIGQPILRTASERIGLPAETAFIPSTPNEYAAYRRFYQTAPATLR